MEWIRVLFHSSASIKPVFTVQSSSVPQLCPTLWSHGLQHARLPCPSPTAGAYSKACPLSQWCQPTILSSVVPFSSCLQSFPASGFFPVSWFFTSGGQSTGASPSASVLPMNMQGWIPLRLTGLISLQSKRLSESSPAPQFESINFLALSLLYGPTLTTKTTALTIHIFGDKVMSLLFNMLWVCHSFTSKEQVFFKLPL